jgi:hypothetical protein
MSTILYRAASQVPIEDWAKNTLSTEELDQFNQAAIRNNTLMAQYEKNGLISHESEYVTVYSEILKTEIKHLVAVQIILAPGVTVLDIPVDPEWASWHARYTSDPNINYNPTVQL